MKSKSQYISEIHAQRFASIDKTSLSAEITNRLGTLRNRLRTALELEHMAVFFQSNAYFQIKSNEEMTSPESKEFHTLEKFEIEGYERAKKLRREILLEVSLEATSPLYKLTNTLDLPQSRKSYEESCAWCS